MTRSADAEDAEAEAAAIAHDATAILDTPDAGAAAIRGSALRTVGFVASTGLATVGAALMIRHLGVVDYGRFVTIQAIIAIVGGLAEGGLSVLGVREMARRTGEDRDRFLASLFGLRLVVAIVGVAIAVVVVALSGFPDVVVAGTAIAGVGLGVGLMQDAYTVPLQATLRLGATSALDFLRAALQTTVVLVLVVAGGGLLAFVAASIPAAAVSLAVTIALVRGTTPLVPRLSGGHLRGVLRDALPVTAVAVVGALYYRVIVILMSVISSDVETGYFAASARVVDVLIVVPGLVAGAAFPILTRAARDDQERLNYAVQRLLDVGLILGGATAVAVTCGASVAIDVVAGGDFAPSADVLRIQGLVFLGSYLVGAFGYTLLASGRQRSILTANGIALSCVIVLALVLVPSHGAQGAAVVMVICELTLAALYTVQLRQTLRLGRGPLVPVLTGGGLAVGAAALSGLPPVVATPLALTIYLAVMIVTRSIPTELTDLLPWRRAT